jgi:branched-chain amino acid transport system ATP-binding protein
VTDIDSRLTLLSAKGISKRFGGVHALSEVGFTIGHGEIYGLIGPNGAGKTSLFNVLTGIYQQDEGEFIFDGQPLTGLAERGRRARHRADVPEHPAVREPVRARERDDRAPRGTHANVVGAIYAARRPAPRRRRLRSAHTNSRLRRRREAREFACEASCLRRPAPARDRARARNRALLLALDEPAAGMNATETALRALLDGIRRDGTTILLIEHDMKLVMSVCDRVSAGLRQEDRRSSAADVQRPEGDRRVSRWRNHAGT